MSVILDRNVQSNYLLSTEEKIVLKARIAESLDPDFIEIEVPLKDLTYENVCRICCEELEVSPKHVLKLRKAS
ncbi:ankyrin repeat domain-containing protein 40 [Caerostris extrusa]|uniref:Ankyrin repeat domain-containing protein 40 n=1 Tax=Caerostris extrusa TaxID=172846 RepID=A0AAV4NLR8_CAEEX|nr:ankyrin repeat domain-containing protein 40 [Caerostris extrusa]